MNKIRKTAVAFAFGINYVNSYDWSYITQQI